MNSCQNCGPRSARAAGPSRRRKARRRCRIPSPFGHGRCCSRQWCREVRERTSDWRKSPPAGQIKSNLPKRINWAEKIQPGKAYDVDTALGLIKEFAKAKFDESVDVAVNLGIDASKSHQQVRG